MLPEKPITAMRIAPSASVVTDISIFPQGKNAMLPEKVPFATSIAPILNAETVSGTH
jgi:hypothetical protein